MPEEEPCRVFEPEVRERILPAECVQDVGAFLSQQTLQRTPSEKGQPGGGIVFHLFVHESNHTVAPAEGRIALEFYAELQFHGQPPLLFTME
ncbi:hypothetical protein THTE_4428 [Thermogutta terrifontis]|uniref:Uncharacterized protein n=1 Tax=Thermogutta terrifontis TaxID=1331910 RepID=A0A286RM29_9BACT|nr:hypothetical protein THTE_4428 [Thermogutta terrifontis]